MSEYLIRLHQEVAKLRTRIAELEAGLQAIRDRSQRILDGEIETLVFGHADYCVQVCDTVCFMKRPKRHIWENCSTHRAVAGKEYDEVWNYVEYLEKLNEQLTAECAGLELMLAEGAEFDPCDDCEYKKETDDG